MPERAASVAVVVLACLAPQLLGGVLPALVLVLAAVALLTLAAVARTARRDVALTLLSIVVLVPAGWTFLQALPLPCALVEALDAESVRGLRRALRLVGAPEPSGCTLSHDPGATRREAVEGITVLAGFFAGFLLAARGRRRTAYLAVGASCVAMALVTMTHTAIEATSIFGLYEPEYVRDAPVVSPLLNPNTLGGFLAPGVPLAIGLALASEERLARALWAIGAAVLSACVLLSTSRGAIGAIGVGLGTLLLLAWRRPSRGASSRRANLERLATTAGAVLLISLALWTSYEQVAQEFRVGGWGKLALVSRAYAFALDHAWLGVGRGAFASTFPAEYPSPHRFEYAESFVAQWAAEWGIPVTALLLFAIAHALWGALRVRRSLATLGAASALVTVAAHNGLDLGIELPGVACVWAILLGATTAPMRRKRIDPTVHRTHVAGLAVAVLAVGVATLVFVGPTLVRDDTERLLSTLRSRLEQGDRTGFASTLAHAVALHPARPELAVLAADEALAHADPSAGRWINRAMALAPGWSAPHLQATRWLWNAGKRRQALVELALAAERDVNDARSYLCKLVRYDAEPVASAAPQGAAAKAFLEAASHCLPADSPGGRRIDAELVRRFPGHPWAHLREAQRALAAGDAARALRLVEETKVHAPDAVELALVGAHALIALDRASDAMARLRRMETTAPSPEPLFELQARTHAALGAPEAMRATLERMRGRAGGRPDRVAQAMLLEGDLEVELGNLGRALRVYDQAHRITNDIDALAKSATIAERLGDRRGAIRALSRLCELAPGRGACARRDALRTGSP